jgi:hypothetical protein
MKFFYFIFLALLFLVPLQSPAASNAAESMRKKLDHIEKNGAGPHPDETPTSFTEDEINGYFASDLVQLPEGVQSVHVTGEDGAITGTAQIDFDQIKSGNRSSNPMLLIFSGTHDVQVNAHAHGQNHQGHVHVDSVFLDGVEIPEFVLQLFVQKYLQPKYPNIGIDSQFPLPDKVDSAKIGKHVLSVIQK